MRSPCRKNLEVVGDGARTWIHCSRCAFALFFSSRRRHTRCLSDWSSDVCSSDLGGSVAALWSRASEFIQAPEHERDLGIELNAALDFQSKDKALNDKPGEMGGFYARLRSEERRVGKEWRSRGARPTVRKKRERQT